MKRHLLNESILDNKLQGIKVEFGFTELEE